MSFLFDFFNVILQEIEENQRIIKEILKFHGKSFIQNYHIQRQKKNIRKKMKKTTNYQQWKELAIAFDKLPGFLLIFSIEVVKI